MISYCRCGRQLDREGRCALDVVLKPAFNDRPWPDYPGVYELTAADVQAGELVAGEVAPK